MPKQKFSSRRAKSMNFTELQGDMHRFRRFSAESTSSAN